MTKLNEVISMGKEKYKTCSSDVFKEVVSSSFSYNEIREKLKNGGYKHSLTTIRKRIMSENISVEHLKGTSWQKGMLDYTKLVKGSDTRSGRLLRLLTEERGHVCECCGNDTWQGQKIPLEVHHIDGNKLNNENKNLVLLCPNCHSLTDNYCGKNLNKDNYISDEDFAKVLKETPNIRKSLIKLGLTPKGANYSRAYSIAVKYKIKHILEH